MPAREFDALVRAWRRRERREDIRAASIVQAISAAAGGKVTLEELIGPDPEVEEQTTPEQNREVFMRLVSAGAKAKKANARTRKD